MSTQSAATPLPREKYTQTARLLHWIIALMVIATVPIGMIMQQRGLARPTQDLLFILHKNGGVIIFALVAARLVWRAFNPAPPLPASVPAFQVIAARAAHWGLYGMLLFMTLTGYVRVRAGGFPVEMLDNWGVPALVPRSDALAEAAKQAHYWGRYVLVALILAHVSAAAYHGLFRRDGVFSRMWPPLGR